MPLNDMELCACGKPLHYSDPQKRFYVEEQISRLGPTTVVRVGDRQFIVPRHFIALHGLITDELPELAKKYKFDEIKPDEDKTETK